MTSRKGWRGKEEVVLEPMGGYGRNSHVLRRLFNRVEILDASKELLDMCPPFVKTHNSIV